MGRIYGAASITLVAAAAEDPHEGLPGISLTPRWAPTPLEVGAMILTPFRSDIQHVFETSKWSTRGWTYQEAILSYRRLVFTKYGLYFQCQMKSVFEGCNGEGAFAPWKLFQDVVEASGWGQVVNYAYRQFTFDEHTLIAFRGYLMAIRNSPEPIQSLAGLPLLAAGFWPKEGTRYSTPVLRTRTDCHVVALLWRSYHELPEENSDVHLHQAAKLDTFPRKPLPSWTWAGWKFFHDHTRFQPHHLWGDKTWASSEVFISVRYADAAPMIWEDDFAEIMSKESSGYSPSLLHICGLSFNLEEVKVSTTIIKNSQVRFGGKNQRLARMILSAIPVLRDGISPSGCFRLICARTGEACKQGVGYDYNMGCARASKGANGHV